MSAVDPILHANQIKPQKHAMRRTVLASVFVGLAILGDSALYAVLPTQVENLGLNAGIVGLALSINRVVRLLTNPLANRLMMKHSVAAAFLWALIASVGSTALWAFSAPAFILLIGRALWGFCWSILRLGGYLAALSDNGTKNARLFGVFRSGFRSGSLIAAVGAGVLTDLIGFRLAFAAMSVVSALGIPLYLYLRPLQDVQVSSASNTVSDGAIPEEQHPSPNKRNGLPINAGAFIHSLVLSLFTTTMGYYLGRRLNTESPWLGIATVNGLLFAWLWISNIAIGPVFGVMADFIGRYRAIFLLIMVECFALGCIALVQNDWAMLLAIMALLSAGAGLEVVLDSSAGAIAATLEQRGRSLSTYTNWADAGGALGPLIGFPLGMALSFPVIYLVGGALLIVWCGWVKQAVGYDHIPAGGIHSSTM